MHLENGAEEHNSHVTSAIYKKKTPFPTTTPKPPNPA